MKLYSRNIAVGCSHDCTYCYSRCYALEKGWIASAQEWQTERLLPEKVNEEQRCSPGVIYRFPTNHDITPALLQPSITYIGNLLRAGNEVAVCTKPHLECIRAICDEFERYRTKLWFEMTITTLNEERSRLFEPGAPLPQERLAALRYASSKGYVCWVRIEPLLEGEFNAGLLVERIYPDVLGSILIGKMVNPFKRLHVDGPQYERAMNLVSFVSRYDNLKALYDRYRGVTRPNQVPVFGFTIPTLEVVDPKQAKLQQEMNELS